MEPKQKSTLIVRMLIFVLFFSTFLLVVDFYSVDTFSNISRGVKFYFVTPVFQFVNNVSRGTSLSWDGLIASYEKEVELENLRSELQERKLDRMIIERLNSELTQLKEQLSVNNDLSFQSSMARVISHDPESHYISIIINKGLKHGFSQGMPVMGYQDGRFSLVGFLSEVSHTSSLVQTLLHQRTEVSVFISGLETSGIVRGQTLSSPFIVLDYIDREAAGLNGKSVESSGIGGKYPPGLPVGYIAYVEERDYRVFRTAYVKPFIDFFSLKSVYVITGNHSIDTVEEEGL